MVDIPEDIVLDKKGTEKDAYSGMEESQLLSLGEGLELGSIEVVNDQLVFHVQTTVGVLVLAYRLK